MHTLLSAGIEMVKCQCPLNCSACLSNFNFKTNASQNNKRRLGNKNAKRKLFYQRATRINLRSSNCFQNIVVAARHLAAISKNYVAATIFGRLCAAFRVLRARLIIIIILVYYCSSIFPLEKQELVRNVLITGTYLHV